MNTLLLWSLIAACAVMEISTKIDTDNLVEKAGIGLIAFGAALQLANIRSDWMLIGCALYFGSVAYIGLKARHDRRKVDHTPKKRKILS